MINNKHEYESGDKNCYQFLFKILTKNFPQEVWTSTYKRMKNDAQLFGKCSNIHWKQIFNSIATEGLLLGVNSKEWLTILKLLEIVRLIENFLKIGGKEIIKWKDVKSGREVFIRKCQNTIKPQIESLIRTAIENTNEMSQNTKNFFLETVQQGNTGFFDSYLRRPEEDNTSQTDNYYPKEESNDYGHPSKRIKGNEGTNDFTYMTSFIETKEENFFDTDSKMKNVEVEEENQSKVLYSEQIQIDQSLDFFINMGSELQHYQSSDKEKIEDLKKQLEEKNRVIEVKNRTIEEKDRIIGELLEKLKNRHAYEVEHHMNYNSNQDDDDLENEFGLKLDFK